ncbi:SDR family oxidoreductase [Yersinia kristensenii]|nr:SDR family oxidoreductase [Yersinia kristensenii]MBW5843252.1 SDR family oxidoreductase [Yersinia kristensenii]
MALTVLERGDSLVATTRNIEQLDDLKEKYGSRIVIAKLDVTRPKEAQHAINTAIESFGRLDLLVNNAGFASIAPFEQMTPEDFDSQMATNFFGVVNLTRVVLPFMRMQKSGHIINISSGAGRIGAPGMSAYSSAKFAVGGFTECVAKEVAAFGVKVIAVEPGSMPTQWASLAKDNPQVLMPEYEESVGHMLGMTDRLSGNEIGDLDKYAAVIFSLSRKSELPYHLLLGSDALFAVKMVEAARSKVEYEWENISKSTDRENADLSFLKNLSLD